MELDSVPVFQFTGIQKVETPESGPQPDVRFTAGVDPLTVRRVLDISAAPDGLRYEPPAHALVVLDDSVLASTESYNTLIGRWVEAKAVAYKLMRGGN